MQRFNLFYSVLTVAGLAIDEGAKHRTGIAMTAERSGNGFKLTGDKQFVTHGHVADLLIVGAGVAGLTAAVAASGAASASGSGASQKATGERDALVTMEGLLKQRPIVASAFDFAFMGGSMGSVVGGSAAFVDGAWRLRKMLGGGVHQGGVLGAAGLVTADPAGEARTVAVTGAVTGASPYPRGPAPVRR